MADLRFSNQGSVVLGAGGSYPSYASIPSVFGGPQSTLIISAYNRGGPFVPDTIYNQSIPTTIGPNNPVDFSDYYTTTKYIPSSGGTPPDIPNPRPTNPNDPTPKVTTVIPQITSPQAAYIGEIVSMGYLATKNGPAGTFTCSSVTIDGIIAPNVAANPSNIQFVVQGGMNYNPSNRSNVQINVTQLDDPININNYFARYALNYQSYGRLSAQSAAAGQQIQISNLLSLQTNPSPSVTIGGVPQTIDNIVPHDNIQNDIVISISEDTPTETSPIVIRNARGDSVTLPIGFRRATNANPVDPVDRGGPPSIDWTAAEGLNETLLFTFSSDLQIADSSVYTTTPPGDAPPKGLRNVTTSDPGNGNGNQAPYTDYDSEFGYREVSSSYVQVGTVAEDVILPITLLPDQTTFLTMKMSGTAGLSYGGYYTIIGYFPAGNGTYITSGTVGTNNWNVVGGLSFNSSLGVNTQTIRVRNTATVLLPQVIIPAGTPIYASLGVFVSTTVTLPNPIGPDITVTGGKYYVSTRNGYPINYGGSIIVQSYRFGALYLFASLAYRGTTSHRFWWSTGYNLGNSLNQYAQATSGLVSGYNILNRDIFQSGSVYFGPFLAYVCTFNESTYISAPIGLYSVTGQSASYLLGYGNTSSSTTGFQWSNYNSPALRFYYWGSTVVVNVGLGLYSLSTNSYIWVFNNLRYGILIDMLVTDSQYVFVVSDNGSLYPDHRLYYLNNGSTTPNEVTGWTYGSSAKIPEYVNLNGDGTYDIILGKYSIYTRQYYVTALGQEDTLDPAPAAYWYFYRPASDTYEELNINLILQPNQTNTARAQGLASALTSNWGGKETPSTSIVTDNFGNTILIFDTGDTVVSQSTLTLAQGNTQSGTLTMSSSGGSNLNSGTFSRLQVNASGQVYVDGSYGYVGSLTFTHNAQGFDTNSDVIPNSNQPSAIRDIIFY